MINIAVSWTGIESDEIVMNAARSIISRGNSTAYAQGKGHPFLYQNYASQEQDVFFSYGIESQTRLREVSKKYDPYGVWQKLQPGYFKVFD